jgi:hypothetical protein
MNFLELTVDLMNEASVFLSTAKGIEKKRYVLNKLAEVIKDDEYALLEPICDGLIDLLCNVAKKRVKLNFLKKKGIFRCW